jgi:hypothetical protein
VRTDGFSSKLLATREIPAAARRISSAASANSGSVSPDATRASHRGEHLDEVEAALAALGRG